MNTGPGGARGDGRAVRPARDVAVELVRRLQDAGHVAYFAGGCVRDQLLGIDPHEYDIATDAVPDRLKEIFPRARLVGESFGVVLVHSGGHSFDIATFRSEGGYTDHRHPDAVVFSDAREDARRRDFTINGIFHDPVADTYFDDHDGRKDLQAGLLRAIGDPDARFEEDHLRMLRAVRFAARFDLEIDPATFSAIRNRAGNLKGVSAERVGGEIRRMAVEGRWTRAVELLASLELDEAVLGTPASDEQWTRCGHLDAQVPAPSPERYQAALAAWMLDRAGSVEVDLGSCQDVGDRLVLSNQDRAGLLGVIEIHARLAGEWERMDVAAQKRLAVREQFSWARLLLEAVDPRLALHVRERVAELSSSGLSPEPLLKGSDMIAEGMVPGPYFGTILEQVYDAQLEGRMETREEALQLAKNLAEEGKNA